MSKTAWQLGYQFTDLDLNDVFVDEAKYDLVPVGQHTKRGDEFVLHSGQWIPLSDPYIDLEIQPHFHPIRRRKRWDCWHLREDTDKWCPVCHAFMRFVVKKW